MCQVGSDFDDGRRKLKSTRAKIQEFSAPEGLGLFHVEAHGDGINVSQLCKMLIRSSKNKYEMETIAIQIDSHNNEMSYLALSNRYQDGHGEVFVIRDAQYVLRRANSETRYVNIPLMEAIIGLTHGVNPPHIRAYHERGINGRYRLRLVCGGNSIDFQIPA